MASMKREKIVKTATLLKRTPTTTSVLALYSMEEFVESMTKETCNPRLHNRRYAPDPWS